MGHLKCYVSAVWPSGLRVSLHAMLKSASTRFADSDEMEHSTTDTSSTVTTADSIVQLGYALPHGLVEPNHGVDHIGVNARPLLDR